jgi:nitrous oxidase accessory protein
MINRSSHTISLLRIRSLLRYNCVHIFVLILSVSFHDSLAASEITVRAGESIQSAIDSANTGDVVKVEHGLYENIHLIIDKPLVLRGLERPTLSGNSTGDVIRIKSVDVVIEGFIVRDSGSDLTAQNAGIYVEPGSHRTIIKSCDLIYNLFGIWFEASDYVKAIDNLITGKRDLQSAQRGNGIQLYNSQHARIAGNNISFARDAIYVDISHHAEFRNNKLHHLRYGTHYMNSYHNLWEGNETYLNRGGLALMEVKNQIVRNNIAWGNMDHGIMLRTMQDSVVENNIVAGNGKGFFIYNAVYNVIKNNLVISNDIGIHLWAGSYNNEVEANDFINNRHQIRYVASRDETWGKRHGNYWSNYSGWDQDANGTGDVPYEANDMVDHLTWKYPGIKLLYSSPAVQSLRLVGRQFPVLRSPSIVDRNPKMLPFNKNWRRWLVI